MRSPLLIACAVFFSALSIAPSARGQIQAKPGSSADGYEARAREDLAELGGRIDAIERRARADGERSREGVERRVRRLRADKVRADERLLKLDTSAADAGRDAREGLERAIRDLKRACRDLERDLGIRPAGGHSSRSRIYRPTALA